VLGIVGEVLEIVGEVLEIVGEVLETFAASIKDVYTKINFN